MEKEHNKPKPPAKKRTTTKRPAIRAGNRINVALEELKLVKECQVRVKMNDDAIEDYVRSYKEDPKALPEVKAVDVGGVLHVVDGWHRVKAARQAEVKTMRCLVLKKGTIEDARALSLEQNHKHGVRLSQADKRKAVLTAVDLGWLKKPNQNRAVAKKIGVSHTFVAKVLAELEAAGADERVDEEEADLTGGVTKILKAAESARKAAKRAHNAAKKYSGSTRPHELGADLVAAAEAFQRNVEGGLKEAAE